MSKKKGKSAEPERPKTKKLGLLGVVMAHPLVALISLAATLLGVLFGALELLPRVVVSPPSGDAMDVSFDITNSGFIALKDTGACLIAGELITSNGGIRISSASHVPSSIGPHFCRPAWQHHDLERDERFTIRLTDALVGVEEADIAIEVTYSPWLLPIPRTKMFRFIATGATDDKKYWRSWPIGAPRPDTK